MDAAPHPRPATMSLDDILAAVRSAAMDLQDAVEEVRTLNSIEARRRRSRP